MNSAIPSVIVCGAKQVPSNLASNVVRDIPNAAMSRLAKAIDERNVRSPASNYTRQHHRHNRS